MLVVDAGDDLSGPAVPLAQKPLRARLILEALQRFGVRAMAIGERDREPGVPLDAIPNHARLRVAGFEVGVFSLETEGRSDLEAGSALRREAAELRKGGAAIVVALLHGGPDKARAALKAVAPSGVTVAVVSHGFGLAGVDRAGDAWLVQCPPQGKQFCQLDLHVLDGKLDFVDAGPRAQIEAMLGGQQKALADVDARQASSDGALRDYYEKQKDQIRQMIDFEKRQLATAPPPPTGSWVESRQTPLGTEVSDDKEVAAMVARYKAEVAKLPPPPPPPRGGFVGGEACVGCHKEAHEAWSRTKHARAFATLEKKGQQADQACVNCHVTGKQPALRDVQCEACHGPGQAHLGNPLAKALVVRDPPESTCLVCHTKDQTGSWDFAAFRKAVLAPGHGLPAVGGAR